MDGQRVRPGYQIETRCFRWRRDNATLAGEPITMGSLPNSARLLFSCFTTRSGRLKDILAGRWLKTGREEVCRKLVTDPDACEQPG